MTMTRRTQILNTVPIYLCALSLLPTAFSAQCFGNGCDSSDDFNRGRNTVITTAAIVGIVIGVTALLSLVGIIFAIVRYRRIKRFQRSYVQNAQANAAAMNENTMGAPPTYPATAHSHHTHGLHHSNMHNQHMDMHHQAHNNALQANNNFTTGGFGGAGPGVGGGGMGGGAV
ncbi:hypothetical protein R3P38DRAFT_2826579 [Favolaschia claudopus]|uniref:Uncharacterized protein n=1 Tax=Favolaschia claudopus TaxID=2862362 RepID=A0AAW0EKM4_9AGAR